MALPEIQNFVAGEWQAPTEPTDRDICNPNNGAVIAPIRNSNAAQIEAALACAEALFQSEAFEAMGVEGRAALLDAAAEAAEDPELIAQMAEGDASTCGMTITTSRHHAALMGYNFRLAAKNLRDGILARTVPGPAGDVEWFMRPWGCTALIGPFNAPIVISSHKVASALAAGAPAILKPSEWTPHSAMMIVRAVQRAGFPTGALQLLQGNREVGSRLVGDNRIASVSFTGGVPGGQAIAAATAARLKPLQLELGGNNPLIVFADADLDAAAKGIVFGLTTLNGQWCRGLGRVLVHASVKDALLEKVLALLAPIRLGDSLDPDSDMGPLVNRGQYELVCGAVEALLQKGGRSLSSTAMPDLPGHFVAPTLIDGCDPQDTREEIFGPVAYVHSFSDDEEAVALGNGTELGLAAYLYSADEARAFRIGRRLRTGGVKINGYSLLSLNPNAPRANWGLSGLNDEGAVQTIQFFCGNRVVGVSPQD